MIVIGPRVLDNDVFGGAGTEGRGVGARGARRLPWRLLRGRLRGRRSPRRGALGLLLGLMAPADPAVAAAAAAAPAASTPDEAAAA